MVRSVAVTILGMLVLSSCAPTTPSVALKDVKTSHVYSKDKMKLLDAVRSFCPKYDFTLRGVEAQSGRVRGYKKMATLRDEDTRLVMMLVSVTALPDGKSRVDAQFVYDKFEGTPTRHDEAMLVDYYNLLFKHLDSELE